MRHKRALGCCVAQQISFLAVQNEMAAAPSHALAGRCGSAGCSASCARQPARQCPAAQSRWNFAPGPRPPRRLRSTSPGAPPHLAHSSGATAQGSWAQCAAGKPATTQTTGPPDQQATARQRQPAQAPPGRRWAGSDWPELRSSAPVRLRCLALRQAPALPARAQQASVMQRVFVVTVVLVAEAEAVLAASPAVLPSGAALQARPQAAVRQ